MANMMDSSLTRARERYQMPQPKTSSSSSYYGSNLPPTQQRQAGIRQMEYDTMMGRDDPATAALRRRAVQTARGTLAASNQSVENALAARGFGSSPGMLAGAFSRNAQVAADQQSQMMTAIDERQMQERMALLQAALAHERRRNLMQYQKNLSKPGVWDVLPMVGQAAGMFLGGGGGATAAGGMFDQSFRSGQFAGAF